MRVWLMSLMVALLIPGGCGAGSDADEAPNFVADVGAEVAASDVETAPDDAESVSDDAEPASDDAQLASDDADLVEDVADPVAEVAGPVSDVAELDGVDVAEGTDDVQADTDLVSDGAEEGDGAVVGVCGLPLDPGNCLAAILRYGFNPATGTCEEFIWGGCGGNENNFETMEACESVCPGGGGEEEDAGSGEDADSAEDAGSAEDAMGGGGEGPGDDICGLPLDSGNCFAAFPRYGFNPATGACEQFIWGGCGGNENNFETMEACEAACIVSG